MKTHDLARTLELLANALREGANIEIEQLPNFVRRFPATLRSDEIKIGLSHLVALSRVDRRQWIALINEYRFPIEMRPRDASRDILGKLLSYLEKNAEARERLTRSTTEAGAGRASPELLKALKALLRD